MTAHYRFLPWVREGAAAAVATRDTLGGGVPGRAVLPLGVRVNQRTDLSLTLRLFGPGDVTGFDRRVVVRTDPPHLAAAFEPNYFPAVELDVPALPWLLTPATGDARARLRPWLCLVVVRKQPGVTLSAVAGRRLPVLGIRTPARPANELPDLAESWAWAHAQVVSGDDEPTRELLGERDAAVSRLVCPRRLRPGESYHACLVPAFAAGRRAGLDEPPAPQEDAELAPAWRLSDDPASVDLPVYFHWEFSTGVGGDFEALVRRLEGRAVPEGVGRSRPLEVGDASFGLPDGGVLPLEGALRAPGEDAGVAVPPDFTESLLDLLNTPDAIRDAAGEDEPVVAPPIYGGWQAAQRRIDDDSPVWLRAGNLDPRLRAAAGLGTLVVQDQQEDLMASAWEQLGAAGGERGRMPQRELAHTVMGRVHRAIATLSPERFLRITAPLHARVRLERPGEVVSGGVAETVPRTVRDQIAASALPVSVTSAPFRRVTRPLGPLARRAAAPRPTPVPVRTLTFAAHFHELSAEPLVFTQPATVSASVDAAAIEQRIDQLIVLSTMLPESSLFKEAVRDVTSYLADVVGGGAPPKPPTLVLESLQAVVLQKIDPAQTLPPPPAPEAPDTGEPETDSSGAGDVGPRAPSLPGPSFPQPMYEPLRDVAPDMLLPGIEHIPPDTVTLLETNPGFIEAYVVGLNHEMSRELLWREYPSDLRATYFRRFWGGKLGIPDIHSWESESALGSHFGGGREQLVLLIRGELLQRYPRTVIYAVPAVDRRTPGTDARHPSFRAALGPDTTCLGFDLDLEEVRGENGGAGWFFVIEQPPAQARFGLDESETVGRDPGELTDWNDVAWGDMADTEDELDRLSHAPVEGRFTGRRIGALEWGFNAGHMAAITLQRPVRVLLHAADLLPRPG